MGSCLAQRAESIFSSFSSISTSDGSVVPTSHRHISRASAQSFLRRNFPRRSSSRSCVGNFTSNNTLSILRRSGTAWTTVGKYENIAPVNKFNRLAFRRSRLRCYLPSASIHFSSLDLSDATSPKMLGELKVRGYSQYLHPISSIIFWESDATPTNRRDSTSLQVSLFDVTDQTRPKLQSLFEYAGGRQTFSPLVEWAIGLSNNQALGYFSEVGFWLCR